DVVASRGVDEVRERVKAWCRAEGLSAWDRRDGSGFLRNLVVREGRRTGMVQARVVTSAGDFRAGALAEQAGADSFLWTRTGGVSETTREGETLHLHGPLRIAEELDALGARLR